MDNSAICPLCGGPNDCGVVAGKGPCWCFATDVPAEVIAQVPPEQRGTVCVCARCAQRTADRPQGPRPCRTTRTERPPTDFPSPIARSLQQARPFRSGLRRGRPLEMRQVAILIDGQHHDGSGTHA